MHIEEQSAFVFLRLSEGFLGADVLGRVASCLAACQQAKGRSRHIIQQPLRALVLRIAGAGAKCPAWISEEAEEMEARFQDLGVDVECAEDLSWDAPQKDDMWKDAMHSILRSIQTMDLKVAAFLRGMVDSSIMGLIAACHARVADSRAIIFIRPGNVSAVRHTVSATDIERSIEAIVFNRHLDASMGYSVKLFTHVTRSWSAMKLLERTLLKDDKDDQSVSLNSSASS